MNHREIKITTDDYHYRIFRTRYAGGYKNAVAVYRHDRDWEAKPVIVDCIGDEQGRVFEIQGELFDSFQYGSRPGCWTLKEVAEFVNERIGRLGDY